MYLAQKKKNEFQIHRYSVCTELHSKFYYTMLFLVLTTDCNNSSSSTKFVATVLYAKATIVYNVSSYSIFESTLPCVMIIYIKWCLLQKIKCQLCIFLKGESPFHSWFNIYLFIFFKFFILELLVGVYTAYIHTGNIFVFQILYSVAI